MQVMATVWNVFDALELAFHFPACVVKAKLHPLG